MQIYIILIFVFWVLMAPYISGGGFDDQKPEVKVLILFAFILLGPLIAIYNFIFAARGRMTIAGWGDFYFPEKGGGIGISQCGIVFNLGIDICPELYFTKVSKIFKPESIPPSPNKIKRSIVDIF